MLLVVNGPAPTY